MEHASRSATRLATMLVAAGNLRGLVESRPICPSSIDEAEYQNPRDALIRDLADAIEDPLSSAGEFGESFFASDGAELLMNLGFAHAIAMGRIAKSLGLDFSAASTEEVVQRSSLGRTNAARFPRGRPRCESKRSSRSIARILSSRSSLNHNGAHTPCNNSTAAGASSSITSSSGA